MNRKIVIMTLKTMCSIFRAEFTEELENIWQLKLAELSDSEIEGALNLITDDPKLNFLPTPAQFKEYARANGQATMELAARQAWKSIIATMESVGPYSSIDFGDHALTKFIKEKGGWVQLCSLNYEALEWLEKDFLRAYPLYRMQRAEGPTLLEGVAGFKNVIDIKLIEGNKKIA